ncbi:BolA-like family protein [Actinidia rufa]|uniref:BolA-like family protein n=1 Tax=Actinidia rufa TaxID=165716 RepID=A0A7J0EEE9_9ERIC|nr:BolA-like family protein [Actinidia rufa]
MCWNARLNYCHNIGKSELSAWPMLLWISLILATVKSTKKEVIDTSGGCGASFAIEIVSAQFEGKRLLERHRMVNAALVEEMKEIHALSIKKALTPDQWKQQQESEKSQSTAQDASS